MKLPDYDLRNLRECRWCYGEIARHRKLTNLWVHTTTILHRCPNRGCYAKPKEDLR